jgi:tight adherence protein B
VAGFVLGTLAPYLMLLLLQNRRQRLIQAQLPDAFHFLARSLRAGLTLDQALEQAGRQLAEPAAEEFRRCSGQIELGLPPREAVQLQALRLRLLDFDVFASTIALYYSSGGNLALLLDRIAAGTRDRNEFRGYFRAATALGRTTAFFIGAAVPALLVGYAVWQPDYVGEFFRNAVGWQFIAFAAVLEVIGTIWIYLLLRVDY